jgi:hypothetical protein
MSNTIHPLKIDLLKIPGARKFQAKDDSWHVAIPATSLYMGEKSAYLDCDLTERKQIDEYKNTHNIAMAQSKEDRQAKAAKVYIGNGKTLTFGDSQPQQRQSAPVKDDKWIDESDDFVPF